jgi:trafficking protein particle complex subunit 4
MITGVFIINKAGGLIFHSEYGKLTGLSSNDYLIFASTFHGINAIATQISPERYSQGIEVLETDAFKLQCLQSLTGLKFLVLADPIHTNLDAFLKRLYQLYSDYVLKNPFYTLEMPIRCDLFDRQLARLVKLY